MKSLQSMMVQGAVSPAAVCPAGFIKSKVKSCLLGGFTLTCFNLLKKIYGDAAFFSPGHS